MIEFVAKYSGELIAFLALLTSLVSSIISFFTYKLQRTHNIKSVKPIIQVGQWDFENVLFVDLKNAGSGIAMVKRIIVMNDRDEHKSCLYEWLPKKLPGGMNYKAYWTGYKDFAVQPGQIIKLVELPIDTSIPDEKIVREQIRAILRQLTVRVEYKDIYDNEMPTHTLRLHHFARTDNEN